MPIKLTNSKNSVTLYSKQNNKTNMTTIKTKTSKPKVVQYDVDFIYEFRHTIQRELPHRVMKTLHMNTKIRAVMNEKDLKIFNRNLDNFDVDALKKKLNSLLNKLTAQNIDGIFQQVSQILKNRKVLIEFAIKKLMMYAIQMQMLIDTYAKFYQKLYTQKTEKIFQDTFAELMDVLNGKIDSKVNSAKDYDKFCKYLKDKVRYSGLHLFLASLYELKIIKKKQLTSQLKVLEDTIIKSTAEENEKYAECYVKLLKKLNKKEFIDLEKINEIKSAGVLKPRMRFAMLDIGDLYKKL